MGHLEIAKGDPEDGWFVSKAASNDFSVILGLHHPSRLKCKIWHNLYLYNVRDPVCLTCSVVGSLSTCNPSVIEFDSPTLYPHHKHSFRVSNVLTCIENRSLSRCFDGSLESETVRQYGVWELKFNF